jgi:RsiW-degrading membrane proteinase PrsW (M82 family)
MKQIVTPALISVIAGLAMPLLLGWLASRRLHVHDALDRMRIPILMGALVTVPVSLYEHVVMRLLGAAPSPSAFVLAEHFVPDQAALIAAMFRRDVLRASIGAALPEELLMAACLYGWLWYGRRHRRRHQTKEIIFAGMAIALAFAAIENALFLQNIATALRVLVLRSLISTPEHAANGFGVGIFAALAVRAATRRAATGWGVAGVVLALVSHAVYDAVVMIDSTALRAGLVLPAGGLALICLALAAALGIIVGPALYGLHRLSHGARHRRAELGTTP